MKKQRNLLSSFPGLVFCLAIAALSVQRAAAQHSVFFFGNYVDIDNKTNFQAQLEKLLQKNKTGFTLLLSGDLVDQKIGEKDGGELLEPLFQLTDLVEKFPEGKLLLLAGDRDWNNNQKGGEKNVLNLQKNLLGYVKNKGYKNTKWLANDACPGPEVHEVHEGLVILGLNSQWWNHRFDKPRPTDGFCGGLNPEDLKEELEDLIAENQDKNILLVGHHPIYSLGNYGGYFSAGQQLLPLPVIGSFRTAFHANAGKVTDLANARLHAYSEQITNTLFFNSNILYAAAHEKNQQIIRQGNNYLLNSGAPTSGKYAAKDENTVYSDDVPGIMELIYADNGQVEVQFHRFRAGQGFEPGGNYPLFQSSCVGKTTKNETVPLNTSWVPCKVEQVSTDTMLGSYPLKTQVVAGPEYKAGWWKKLWFGNHYRTTWTTPVSVPYLNLDTVHGGLTIYEKGGGRQTTSLKFKSRDGSHYTFRSVNKDPSKALNYHYRPTIATSVLRDQTSTQHPYGAMVVAPLLEKIGILHATPKLYVLPNDPKLGSFQQQYGNLFGMLEESPGKPNDQGEAFGGADKILQSTDLFREIFSGQKIEIDEEEFVRARLFDMWVGDWSKHENNWKWASYKQDGFTLVRPIPRDRDHVFSRQDGILPWITDRRFILTNLEDFDHSMPDIHSLANQPRHMDRLLTAGVPKEVFMAQVQYIQSRITDADIDNAVRQMPPEVYQKSGAVIADKLKVRLQDLQEYAEDYYAILSLKVDVVGSNEAEFFEVKRNATGSVQVQIFDTERKVTGRTLLYDRTFLPNETKEVRLWGLGGDDIFHISGSGPNKITLRTFGGPGDDVFKDEARAKTLLYDRGEGTKYELGGNARIVRSWNKEIYEYDRLRHQPNRLFALPYIFYNRFTGLGLNLGATYTVRNFGKDLYSSKHSLNASVTTQQNFAVSYLGRFHQVIRKWDTEISALYAKPDYYNYFYGLGNNTSKSDSQRMDGFYDAKVNRAHLSLGIVRDFWQKSAFRLTAGIEQDESEPIAGTFLSHNASGIFGAHQKLTIVPLEASLDLDFRDNPGLPYRGTRALLGYRHGFIVDGPAGAYGVAEGALEYYLSTRAKRPITLGIGLGAAESFGDVPWYELPTLGDLNGLRGYFHNRFTGASKLFAQAELRYQFLDTYTALVPIKVGVKGFYDTGRILHGGEEVSTWRQGYGFGIYLVPLEGSFTVSLTFGFSDEESFYPTFSIGAPLR